MLRTAVETKRKDIDTLSTNSSALRSAIVNDSANLKAMEQSRSVLGDEVSSLQISRDALRAMQEQSSLLSLFRLGHNWDTPASTSSFSPNFRVTFRIDRQLKRNPWLREAATGECGLEFKADFDVPSGRVEAGPRLTPIVPPIDRQCKPAEQKFWACMLGIASSKLDGVVQSCFQRTDLEPTVARVAAMVERVQTLAKDMAQVRLRYNADVFVREISGVQHPIFRVSLARSRRPLAQVVVNFDLVEVMNYPKCRIAVDSPFVAVEDASLFSPSKLQQTVDSTAGFARIFRACQTISSMLN